MSSLLPSKPEESTTPRQETPAPWPALIIQMLALFITTFVEGMGGGILSMSCLLASLPFWAIAAHLVFWRGDGVSRWEVLFLRWGLLLFVLIGTPALAPLVAFGLR